MLILVLGVILWAAAFLLGRLFPQLRAAMGGRGRYFMAVLALLGLALMAHGYSRAETIVFWGGDRAA